MNKKIIAVIILIFIFVSIPLTVYLVKRQQELRLRAAPATTLSVSPATLTKTVNDVFGVNIQINSGDNQTVGTDLYLSFNNLVLEALTITPGSFFDSPQELAKNIDNQTGKIIYSLGSFTSKQGSGVLASISFKARDEGISSLTFDSGTSVAGIGETEALQNTVPGSFTIVAARAISSPTPTPTEILSATPSPSPGAGGLETPPTPTETPTPTPTGGIGGSEPTATPTPTTAPGTTPTSTLTPTPTSTVSAEGLPETGIFTSTLLFLIGGGALLVLGFLGFLL